MKCRITVLSLVLILTGLVFVSGVGITTAVCPPEPPYASGVSGDTGVAASHDPNALTGPAGYGDKHYVALGTILPYRIDFENDAAASAPAQQVDITNNLDQNLDWSTFQITEIGFGDTLIPIPPNTSQYETTVSMTYQDVTFDVQIKAGIDQSSGDVYAHFYSIDPETGLPPSVEIGFLPPEDETGRGKGHISYIINHVADIAEDTEIRNIALIVFDMGEEIYTNQVDPHDPAQGTDPQKEALVTIDANRPSSAIVYTEQVNENTYTLFWGGYDSGSNIAGYKIYYRDAGQSAWEVWQDNTQETSADFTGDPGHTYEFYITSTDNVGYQEQKDPVPETKLFIPGQVVDDSDADGIADTDDNCPLIANPDQADLDADGLGDACDDDEDGDGIADMDDNCPSAANADQADMDGDGLGDICDTDNDDDSIADTEDNCPSAANTDQADQDNDGLGDVCDACPLDADNDIDGDEVCGDVDNCPAISNTDQEDLDKDGLGDICDDDDDGDTVADRDDNCPLTANTGQADLDGDGLGNACDDDDDGDTVADTDDNCPLIANPDQADTDSDGLGNVCDDDDDGDTVADTDDNCPLIANPDQADPDADGLGNACDDDDDGDGIADLDDNCPLTASSNQADLDNDGLGNVCDDDDDGDNIADLDDNCPLIANPDQADLDSDGLGNVCDDDDDGDNIADLDDNCPLIANPDQADPDADGLGNACDDDDDGDTVADTDDNCPLIANPDQADLDSDGLGNVCDDDDDGDNIADTDDNCPLIANPNQADRDSDGLGDVCDACPLDADNDLDDDGVCGDVDNCPAISNADQANLDQDNFGDLCDPQTCGNGILETIEKCDDGNFINGDGCSAQCITESFISLFKAEVEWNKGRVKLQGHIELPLGVFPVNVIPQGATVIKLGDLAPMTAEDIQFSVKAAKNKKWEFKDGENLKKFRIDWKGATFDYHEILHVKANHVGLNTTNIEIDREGLAGEFSLGFENVTIRIQADNTVITSPEIPDVDADDSDGEIEVSLPFALTPDMVMVISRPGQPDTRVTVGDYLTNSTGKFDLQANFDPQGLTGLDLPATLNLRIALGRVGYPGYAVISSGWKSIKAKEWKYK